MFKRAEKLSRTLLATTLLLSACGKPGSNGQAIPSAANATAPGSTQSTAQAQVPVSPVTEAVAQDAEKIGLIEAMGGPANSNEENALNDAKEKIRIVKDAQAAAEKDKNTAYDAKALYVSKLKAFQQAQAEAESAKQARNKAAATLASAEKEYDDAKTALSAALLANANISADPGASAEQKAAAVAAVAKANARLAQAGEATNTRYAEQGDAVKNDQRAQIPVATMAEIASQVGSEFAIKATIATRSAAAVNLALAEEKKSMAVIYALNTAKAKATAEALAGAAYSLKLAQASTENAREVSKTATAAAKAAAARLSAANRDALNARTAAETAAINAPQAANVAQAKAEAKGTADADAAQAQKSYNDAKAAFDSANAVSTKSGADAKAAIKALNDANAKVAATAKALATARLASQQATATPAPVAPTGQTKPAAPVKDPAVIAKALADAQAASDAAVDGQKAAQDASANASAQASTDAAITAQAKASADEKLATYRQASSAAAIAAKEKAQADASAAAAAKNAANTSAAAKDREADAAKANLASVAADQANANATEKFGIAKQAEADAREKYNSLYTKRDAYQLSPTKTEDELQAEDQKLFGAALWAGVPEGNYWTSLVVASIRQNLPHLERAKDINSWCPGYADANDHQHVACWLRLLGGVIKFESSFKPDDAFKEPTGNWSVGLMALSPRECTTYESVELLKQPLLNLSCGISKFATLVDRDGYIAGPSGSQGASAYWSTLRAPYEQAKPDGQGVYHLGKKDQILPFTTTYRNF